MGPHCSHIGPNGPGPELAIQEAHAPLLCVKPRSVRRFPGGLTPSCCPAPWFTLAGESRLPEYTAPWARVLRCFSNMWEPLPATQKVLKWAVVKDWTEPACWRPS